jgi:hypothetical protein
MKKILNILGFIYVINFLMINSLISQNFNYNMQSYYAGGIPHYWTDDSTSVNIIISNMENYGAIVDNLHLLFPDSTNEILADNEDDNIIVNSLSLPLLHKDSIISFIEIDSGDVSFFTYSKWIDNGHIWLRNEVLIKLKDTAYFQSIIQPIIQHYDIVSTTFEGDNEYSIICKTETSVITLSNLLYDTSFVIYSTPDFYGEISLNTNDTYFCNQWGLKNLGQNGGSYNIDIQAEEAWAFLQNAIGSKGCSIKVAVIDDGVEPHEDLYDEGGISAVLEGYTANGDGTGRPRPNNRHGQCCAGIISARHNGIGVAG